MRRARAGSIALVVAILATVLGWCASGASAHGLVTGFADDIYLRPGAHTRAHWLLRSRQEGAGLLRIDVHWADIVGSKPAHPRNPDDPAYDWSSLDPGIAEARAGGFQVMLTVLDAPVWAEGTNPAPNAGPGSWKPNPAAFGNFGHAIASRYSGHFVDGSGATLPRVRYFEAWTEPNFQQYLAPQWHGTKPASPGLYRRLLNAFQSGVKTADTTAKIVGPATAPTGDAPGGLNMHPVTFLRNLFCLSDHCKGFRKPKLDILSVHPITVPGANTSAREHAALPGDIFVADFGKVRRILHAAERVHHIAGRHHPLWATEFWWLTNPPTPGFGVSWAKQARWINLALYLLWKQGASVALNFEIKDRPEFGSGLYTIHGAPKPSARTFRFPFVVHGGRHGSAAWGKAPRSGRLEVQRFRHGRWRTIKGFRVKRGAVFNVGLRVPRWAKLRGKVGSVLSGDSSAAATAAEASRLGR